jgi:hypothetical protein
MSVAVMAGLVTMPSDRNSRVTFLITSRQSKQIWRQRPEWQDDAERLADVYLDLDDKLGGAG